MIALIFCAFICAITSARCDGEGGIPGFGSRKMSIFRPKRWREVGPGIVIGDDVLSFKRQQGRAPFLKLGIDGGFEFFVVRVVDSGVGWVDRGKRLRDVLRDRFGNDWVDSEMWIAQRVHVASGTRHIRRHIH